MNDLVQAGKIRYFGCSNWSVSRIRLAANYALEHGYRRFRRQPADVESGCTESVAAACSAIPVCKLSTSQPGTTTTKPRWRLCPIRRRLGAISAKWPRGD